MNNILGVLSLFRLSWLIPFSAISAVCMLIWYAGPLLSFGGSAPLDSTLVRSVVIGVLSLGYMGWMLFKYLRKRRQNDEMADELVANVEETQSEEELATLRENFESALHVLKKAQGKGKGGRQLLYQLPWYIIIGPPGGGKTTALINSGLKFPLAERMGENKIRGVGGTRNCDWWFSDEAVLIDTAGRYTTQDSQESVDSAAWFGFLDLLKKYRGRRPVNGVLVAVALVDLMRLSESEREDHARAIRQRVEELHERLGIRFPVYMLFTKADLLAGFMEFHEELGKDGRNQVWGMTFPLSDNPDDTPLDAFGGELDNLEKRLEVRLTERLQQERDSKRRDLIYGFPQQFASIKRVAGQFLEQAFAPSRYEQSTLLRGVYFTSGTQEGTPIDRLIGSMASSFGLDRQSLPSASGKGRTYFLNHLFKDVIFEEAGLAGTNPKAERRRLWIRRAAFASMGLVLIAGSAAWFTSYQRNQSFVQNVENQIAVVQEEAQALSPNELEMSSILPVLNSARELPRGYKEQETNAPWLMGFGLYQGEKLGTKAAVPAYQRLLKQVMLPRILLRIEEQLRSGSGNPEFVYEGLKVYLMLDEPEKFDTEQVKAWIGLDWDNTIARIIDPVHHTQLLEHLDALFENGAPALPIDPDFGLVQTLRYELNRLPLAERVYARLKRRGLQPALPEFRISDVAGRDAPLVFTRQSGTPLNQGIPGFYTKAAYLQLFDSQGSDLTRQQEEEQWVLGADTGAYGEGDLNHQVQDLYLEDYANQWQALLDDIAIKPFTNLRQATDMLNVLSGPTSPLRKMLAAVEVETTLARQSLAGAADSAQGEQATGVKADLAKLIGSDVQATPAVTDNDRADTQTLVDRRFADLHAQLRALDNVPPPLDRTLSTLNELYVYLNSLAGASGEDMLAEMKKQAGGLIGRLRMDASRQPQPINQWLTALANDTERLTVGGVSSHLNAVWNSEIVPFCQQSLANRYPLVKSSPREVALEDFAQFFGPGGLMDSFFDNYLKGFVDTTGKTWKPRSGRTQGLSISEETLSQFQRAQIIRDTFFRGGERLPGVRFVLKPLSMDVDAEQFMLDLDGQQVIYDHGPARPVSLKWPGEGGFSQVQVQFSPQLAGTRNGVSADGPWALFRLLDQFKVRRTSLPERFRVTFTIGGRSAVYELSASSALNPFKLKELEQFRCPQRL